MRVEYTRRAADDLRKAAGDSRTFGHASAIALEKRFHEIIGRIAEHPDAAAQVIERPGVRVIPLIHYPYKIFYRVLKDRIRILHIRHASRRPWTSAR